MMKLASFSRAGLVLALSTLSVVAAAQSGGGFGLNIPDSVQFVGQQDPSVRKATAIVNGAVITESDIDQRLALMLNAAQVELPPEEVQRFRAQVFRNLIDEVLQIQAAAQQENEVEDAEVNRIFESVAQRNNRTPADFAQYLRSVGGSERSLKQQIRAEIAWRHVLGRNVEPFVTVGTDEVQEIIDRLNASRGAAEYQVAEIFISATPETTSEARANAARIVEQVRNGASFPAYARQFSEASTAALGGQLGWVRAEQLPPELSAVVTQMPVGAITDPIPVPGGYSILALADSRQILVADPRDAILSLMQMSITLPPGTGQAEVARRAQQLVQGSQSLGGGCGRAAEVAQTVGAELVSNDQVRVRDLQDAQLQQALLALSVGQSTPPFGSAERVSVLILCGRDDPQQVNMPSADDIEARLNEERVARRAQRYLRDLRRDAVIDYR
jgi:peptidyl-prolyl cis-trans isomerase SurA